MKIRNIALGFTLALSAALPRAASAAGGDIYDIIPLWGSTTADNAIKAPGDFGFIIRLLDRDFAGAAPSQWAMQHIGPSSEIYDDVYNPLRIGLVISGRLRYATIDSIAATNTACTDIYCSYTVQPGDFALPALLALEGSTPERPVIAGSGVDGAYYLQNSDLWALQNTSGDTAVFRWCDSGTVSQARMLYPALNRETRLGDESLAKGAFFVKTIDFDENTETKDNVTYWRVVNQGSATTQTYVPRIVADSSPESAITLYVWSDNESAVKVNGTDRSITLADGTTATRSVYSFTLGTQTEYDIAFTGQTQGQTANLILAPTPGHVFDAAGHLVTNFLTRTVYCDAPLAPSINVTFDPAYPTSAKNRTVDTSTNTTENLAADVIPLYVVLSEPYGSDLEVSLRLRLEADSSVDVLTNRNISVSRQGDSFSAADAAYTNFTITAGQTRATVYVYPLGGTAATQSQGITFTPVIADTVAADYYNIGESNPATLKIRNNHTPVIVEPAADTGYGTVEATGFQVPIVISDCYRDLNHPSGFKVTATYSDGSSMTATNVVFNEEAESIVTLTGYGANATYATIRVTEPDGNRYATVRVMFEVAPEKTIRAELYDSTSQESANTRTDYDEGEAPLLRFTLSEAMPVNSPSLYAYLVPQGETASNLVACAAFSNGVEIVGGQTQSSLSLANVLTLLDGCAATETRALQFKIVTGTTPTSTVYSLDTTYTPASPLVINVRNVYPGTEALYINGDPRNVPSGGHFSTTLSADVTNRFVASVADASNVDVTNGIMVVWCFSEGRSAARFNYSVVTSTTETVTCPHVFTFPGVTQTVQFAAIDKDMLATLKGDKPLKASDLQELWPRITKMVSPYSATVFVGQAPHITITPDIATIYEDEKSGYLSLELSEAPEKDIDIAIAVQSMADSNPGRLEFQTYTLKIKANQTSPAAPNKTLKYKYSTLDGTAGSTDQGFYVTATVLDEDYTNYFTVGECEVYVRNQAPVISPRQPENAYTNTTMAVGQEFTIDWSVTDVMNDLTNGLTAKWYINDVLSKTLVITNSAPTNTTLVLTQEGFNEVKLVVTDKDGEDYNGRSERTWLYMIGLTKHLDVSPCGPAPDSITKYATMAGSGRVWADGTRNSTASFAQTWYYNVKSANASVYAYGYPAATNSAGYKDDGTLGENYGAAGYRDVAISPAGNGVQSPAASATYYTYTSPYDNFFYRWAYVTPGEGSSAPTVEYSNPRPTPAAGAGVREVITLDPYEANKESYETRVVEAVFSREYLQSDNMGDINQDGIPDAYVVKYTGFGVVDASGAVSGDDIDDISTYNDDGDFLPSSASSAYVSFIPGLASSWVAAGRKFDAFTEIRGFCPSLNNAPLLAGIGSAKPEVSTNTLKDATYGDIEYDAWLLAGAPTLADGVTPDMDRWSPERPTDPTKADTDGDEMPDGYEYYIWYRARVGYWENGEHKFLSGRRYNPMDPGNPGYISPETIASRYDPLVKNTLLSEMDTDNDGLTDLVEFELGTNPFDFDTDADGLPDGYEVLVLETDPLKYATDDVTCDGDLNTDGDAMASALVNMQIIGLAGDNGTVEWFCAPDDTAFQTNAADTAAMGTVFTCAVTENGTSRQATCITTANLTYGTREDGTLYLTCDLSPASTWKAVQADGNYFRNGPVKVMRGTVVTDIAEDQPLLPETLVASPDKCWAAWVYGDTGRLALGAERKHSADELAGRTVVVRPYTNTVEHMHFQVYREKGFDPRTAWKTSPDEYMPATRCVNTRNYTARDELLSMSFFCRLGLLEESAVTPTEQTPWQTIWRLYSTSPLTADTDLDGMPDGWELYIMAGPKVYDKAGDLTLLTSNGLGYGPLGAYSPLASFGDLVGLVRDHDGLEPNKGDGLEWPNEFSGIESAAEYGPKENGSAGTPSITCLNPEWRNKLWPTDPWNADTDGDGIIDGDEGKYFIYGTEGIAGGGLNPLSWDTDHDGLPDPWEMEFRGTWSAGSSGSDTNATDTVTWNNDGMDGTVSDARLDYDSDGLCNWQEYMTGAMRCWRYDDTISTWGMHDFDPNAARAAWDEYWYTTLVDEQSEGYNPHLVYGTFDPGIYFSRCTNVWDGARVYPNPVYGKYYMFRDGVYHDLKYPTNPKYKVGNTQYNKYTYPAATAGWSTLVPPFALLSGRVESPQAYPVKYITCDPRMADTDRDGMDDYYELFHGMNPLLGASGVHKASGNAPYDVVFDAYDMVTKGGWSAENNYWLNVSDLHRDVRVKDADKSLYDFEAFPWLTGLAGADPDGDNIRNQLEAIMPNFQAFSTYLHTDPTPLWMTDTSYTNSFTRRYYRAFPLESDAVGNEWTLLCPNDDGMFEYDGVTYYFKDFPGFSFNKQSREVKFSYSGNFFRVTRWLFDFEENEGYDSDHDNLSDFEEGQARNEAASDPQGSDSPLRRQAMWFNGKDAFLQSPLPVDERPPKSTAGSEPRQDFLYYTVECWAKPAAGMTDAGGGLRTLVERAIIAGNANAADEKFLRKNFVLGLLNGRWYTRFDTPGTDAGQYVEISEGPQATTNWTHVAATYDGSSLRLFVNGICRVAKPTSLQPEHGIAAVNVEDGALGRGVSDYRLSAQNVSLPHNSYCAVSMLVGASAASIYGVVFDYGWMRPLDMRSTTLDDYTAFYRGYIDEVRVWDGARTPAQILADYEARTRYTSETASANREEVYAMWRRGARRSLVSELQLPAQLMYHWSFDHLPGAVRAEDVAKTPAGFATDGSETDAMAIWSRPEGWTCPWWDSVGVRSTVYSDAAWVPWISDTVAHLPRFDKTVLDSVYWSGDFVGSMTVADFVATNRYHSYKSLTFPRTHELYSTRWVQQLYPREEPSFTKDTRWNAVVAADEALGDEDDTGDYKSAYRFTVRDSQLTGRDLLPMGGAYPRRISKDEGGMWDDGTPSDAWPITAGDADNNGLPDWWEDYARQNYCDGIDPDEPLTRDTPMVYDGISMPAWQAYMRDLAYGMVIDDAGTLLFNQEGYRSSCDKSGDGIPDWWQSLFGLADGTAQGDSDNDGLSDYIEYLVGEVYRRELNPSVTLYKFPFLDPTLICTGPYQLVPDYFLPYGRLYLGEMFADHDQIEDDWEDGQPVVIERGDTLIANYSRFVYDAHLDPNDEGWDNWSRARAIIDSRVETTNEVVEVAVTNGIPVTNTSYTVSVSSPYEADPTLRPAPTITASLVYNGLMDVSAAGVVAVVKAWREGGGQGSCFNRKADAVWTVALENLRSHNWPLVLERPDEGYLRMGRNFFVAYLAKDGTDFAPGMPYGVADGVNVGFLSGAAFSIELTDVSPAMMRIDLAKAIALQAAYYTENLADKDEDWWTAAISSQPSDAKAEYDAAFRALCLAQAGLTDRYQFSYDYAKMRFWDYAGTNMQAAVSNANLKVLVSQTTLNGEHNYAGLFETRVKLSSHTVLTEADLAEAGCLDLGWGSLASNYYAAGHSAVSLTNATFTILIEPYDKDLGPQAYAWQNLLAVQLENSYERGSRQSPVTDMTMRTYAGRPTFSWRHPNTIGKDYPAFRLQVWTPDTNLVYDSGAVRAPARDSKGFYNWTAPLYPGMMTPQGAVFEADTTYLWSVSMLDAKFTTPRQNPKQQFAMQATSPSSGTADYGLLPVTVKYAGPGRLSSTALQGMIRVEAYSAADFAGAPAAVAYVTNTANIATNDDLSVNALLRGLVAGGREYYVRAFIDTNGNGVREDWETWGYGSYVGHSARVIGEHGVSKFTPRPYAPANTLPDGGQPGLCVIYLEDSDVNANQLPDIWEWNRFGRLLEPGETADAALSPFIADEQHAQLVRTNAAVVISSSAALAGAPLTAFAASMKKVASAAPLTAADMLAFGGIDVETVRTVPAVSISAFSLDDGLTLDVAADATVDGASVSAMGLRVRLAITLQYACSIDGGWADAGTAVTAVSLASGVTKVGSDDLLTESGESLRSLIGATVAAHPEGSFFRVKVAVDGE